MAARTAEVCHVLGSGTGGGFEWRAAGRPVPSGLTALELDGDGRITRATSAWDGARLDEHQLRALALAPVGL